MLATQGKHIEKNVHGARVLAKRTFQKIQKKNKGSGTCLLAKAFPIRSQGVPKAFPGASQPEGQQASAQAPEQVKRWIPPQSQQKQAKDGDPDETVSKNTQKATILTRLSAKTRKT